jgi:hypothetical protein
MSADEPFDFPDDLSEERETRLALLARFAKGAASARFMARLGRKLSSAELKLTQSYAEALGFPGATVVLVGDFEEAAEAAQSLDIDSEAWEAAEQLRAGLTVRAAHAMGEELLEQSLQDVMAYVAVAVQDAVKDAGGAFDIEDEGLLNTAAGAALRACHNAALVLLAGESEDHALALEYALFEAGRWPVALTGRTLHLF